MRLRVRPPSRYLRDRDHDVFLVEYGLAVTELGGVLDLDGDAGEGFDEVLAE